MYIKRPNGVKVGVRLLGGRLLICDVESLFSYIVRSIVRKSSRTSKLIGIGKVLMPAKVVLGWGFVCLGRDSWYALKPLSSSIVRQRW